MVPINEVDYVRCLKLAEALKRDKFIRDESSPGTFSEMRLYIKKDRNDGPAYVSIEMSGYVKNRDLDLFELKDEKEKA